ncbi:MAG: TMEM175 family protein [Pseudomonadota bacterium]
MRQAIVDGIDHDPDFEWRGRSVTRIENLSDIIFALALGMLVSSSQPPTTFSDLFNFVLNIVPVSVAFAILLTIWNAHFVYFRRYGLADGYIIFLNAILLLLILFTAYPLRFCFDSLFGFVLFQMGYPDRLSAMLGGYREAALVIALYNAAMSIVYFILAQMYGHALRRKKLLDLSAREIVLTRRSVFNKYTQISTCFLAIGFALFSPLGPFAGFFTFLNPPLRAVGRFVIREKKERSDTGNEKTPAAPTPEEAMA